MPPRSYQVLHLHHRWEWLGDRHCHAKGHSVEHANGKCCCCRLALLYSIAASPSCLAAWPGPYHRLGSTWFARLALRSLAKHIGLAKPLAGLKRWASFGAWGGVVHDWCKPGVWPFFVHRLAGVGKPLFWCQISIFW